MTLTAGVLPAELSRDLDLLARLRREAQRAHRGDTRSRRGGWTHVPVVGNGWISRRSASEAAILAAEKAGHVVIIPTERRLARASRSSTLQPAAVFVAF